MAFGTRLRDLLRVSRPGVRATSTVALAALLVAGLPAPKDAAFAAPEADPPMPAAAAAAPEPLTAPDAVSARAVARLEGAAVEVLGERTTSGSVFALPDGTMAAGMASGPVWVRRGGDGTRPEDWAAVDLTLRRGEDGQVRPVAHPSDLVLSGGSTAGTAPDAVVTVAQVTAASGATSSLTWQGALPQPRLAGARAVYPGVRAGVDMVVEAKPSGVEQFFVVHRAPVGAGGLVLPVGVSAEGVGVVERPDGSLEVQREDGSALGRVPQPRMWDARADAGRVHPLTRPWQPLTLTQPRTPPSELWRDRPGRPGGPVGGRGPRQDLPSLDRDAPMEGPHAPVRVAQVPVDRTLREISDGLRLELRPQGEFLTDPRTVYPVVIDPELNLIGGFDTTVQSNVTYDMSTDDELLMGTWNSGATVARSFINVNPTPIRGRRVLNARLYLLEPYSYSCQARNWEVWDTTPVSTSTRWTSQPAWWAKYATSSETRGYSAACPGGGVSAEVTSLAQRWAASSSGTIFGVGLKAESETDSYGWKRFYSADSGQGPWVWVNYNSVPNAPTALTVSPSGSVVNGVRYISTATPRFSATISDPDGGNVTAIFQLLYNGAPYREQVVGNVASGSVASWDLPAGLLTAGPSYSFHVSVSDGLDRSAWVTSSTSFQVDTSAPGAPTVSSADYPGDGTWNGAENQAGSFTLTPAGSDASLVSYRWGLDKAPDPNQTITASTTGAPSTLSVTPTTAGRHVLQVQAVDRAGNTSAVVKYAFNVGRAGIVTPDDGAQVVRRTRLFVTGDEEFTHLRFQWRRGPDAPATSVRDVPVAHLSTSAGQSWQDAASNGWAPMPTGNAYTAWDVGATLGFEPGPLQVRALVATSATGTEQYATAWITLTIDPDATGAATTEIGPSSVNLLTGDHALSVTDAEEFGLAVVRTASSRDTDSGYQLQVDKLSTAQQQASSSTTTEFNPGNTVLATATDRYHTGGSSLKITPLSTYTGHDTYAAVGGNTGALRLGLQPGRAYRFSGWVYVPAAEGAPVPTPSSPRGLRMTLFARVGGVYTEPTATATGAISASPRITNAWQKVSFDAVVPADATEAFVRVYNGFTAASGQVVYWDDLSVRELWSPFGAQWDLGTVDDATGTAYTRISRPYDDVAAVHLTGGGQIWFTSGNGSTWWPQPGAEDLKLTQTSPDTWRLTELDGTVTDFTRSTATKDFPVTTSSPPGVSTVGSAPTRYVYDVAAVPGVSRLSKIIAPVEPGVDGWPTNAQACTAVIPARGCEVTEFTYATSTTATGSVFGSYTGRVSEVSVWSWDPDAPTPGMVKTPVASYAYDEAGRLRQVFDPRIVAAGAPALVTGYEYDTAGRVTTITPAGELAHRFSYGVAGAADTATGDWIDPSPGRLLQVTRASLQPGTTDQAGPDNTTTVVYNVPLTRAAGGPYDLDAAALATWAQNDAPTDATAVFGPQDPPGVTTATAAAPGPSGYGPATVHYLNASGLEVNTASPAAADTPVEGNIDTAEYDRFGNVIRSLDATNRLLALKTLPGAQQSLTEWGLQDKTSLELAQLLDARTTYSADGLDVLVELGPLQRLAVANDPTDVRSLRPRTTNSYDEGKPDGADYHLLTTSVSAGVDAFTGQVFDALTTTTGYNPVDGSSARGGSSGWVHRQPTTVTVDAGQPTATTSTVVYDDRGRVIRSSKPGSTGSDAATTTTTYYTPEENPDLAACGNRPEWAGQPCRTAAAGPVTGHDPTRAAGDLPVKMITGYNKWGSPTVVTESATGPVDGQATTVTRTSTTTYDAADRVTTVAITGDGAGAAVATTRSVYDPATGDVTAVQSLDAAGQVASSVSKTFDNLGRLVSYTDAGGATTTTRYDRYGNPDIVTQTIAGTTVTTDYTYDRTQDPRGYVTSVADSVAGTIAATWGPDGQLLTQTLPGGLTLTIGYDTAQVPVRRSYTRASDDQVIFTDAVVENHRGQWISHSATTGDTTYTYDRLGRLTGVTDTVAGSEVCTTRAYGFTGNPRTNRTQYAAATGTTGAGCPEVTLEVTATYDSADRLMSTAGDGNARWVYDPLGRTTTMPHDGATVANEYYVNDLIAAQTHPGNARMTWTLDPLHRRTTNVQQQWVNDAWVESATKVAHYDDDSDEPSWIAEDTTLPTDITRYVTDLQGGLALTTSTTGDRVLQLVDLHGDITATLPIADGATQATWTALEYARSDEFGNPTPLTGAGAPTGPPARYGWLGAAQRSAETLGETILMGVRLYHTPSGRFLTPDPEPGGSANTYDYCNADPVNCTDLDGTWSRKGLLKGIALVGEIASFIPGPIGAAAAAVSAVAYAAQGNRAKALEMGITAAAQLVGAGPVVRVAARAVNVARASGQVTRRAAPKAVRSAATRTRSNCARNSFTPGTLVLMADGSLTPIESVKRGDMVLTTDPLTGKSSAQPVLTPITGVGTKHLINITTSAGTLTATANHPIWIHEKGWTNAEDLTVGDQLLGSTGGLLVIRAMHDLGWLSGQTVYNLHVAGTHTYFVALGSTSLDALVHNRTACVQTNRKAGLAWEADLARYLRSTGASVRQGVTVPTPFGRRVLDLEVSRSGQVVGYIEAKVGRSRYHRRQRIKDEWIMWRSGRPVQVVRKP